MCWENLEGVLAEEPNEKQAIKMKPDDKMEKPNYDKAQEEHANHTLHMLES